MARKSLRDAPPPAAKPPRKRARQKAADGIGGPTPGAPPAEPPPKSAADPRIERIDLDRVNPAPYNPRKDLQPGDPEFAKLARSIDEFGCAQVLVFNERTGNLVGGHQTLKVLRHLGRTDAMMSVVDLPPAREKTFNLALNRIHGDWDLEKLAELAADPELDAQALELGGFDEGEVERMLEQLEKEHDDENEDEDEEDEPKQRTVTSAFEAVAVCNDEPEQQKAYNLLKQAGYTAKLRTLY